jgi:hypothetical protein
MAIATEWIRPVHVFRINALILEIMGVGFVLRIVSEVEPLLAVLTPEKKWCVGRTRVGSNFLSCAPDEPRAEAANRSQSLDEKLRTGIRVV